MPELDEDLKAEIEECENYIEEIEDEIDRIVNEIQSLDLQRNQFSKTLEKQQRKRTKAMKKLEELKSQISL